MLREIRRYGLLLFLRDLLTFVSMLLVIIAALSLVDVSA